MARIFLSHSTSDPDETRKWESWLSSAELEHSVFVDWKIDTGKDWEKEIYREIEKAHAVVLLVTPDWHTSNWCFTEFRLARSLEKTIFPIIPESAPPDTTLVSPDIQHFDLRKGDPEEKRRRLAEEINNNLSLEAQRWHPWPKERTPFPGLTAFQEDDAAVYFGRDPEISKLVELLNQPTGTRFVTLLGASGTGKSSLLRAGLIPELKRPHRRRQWVVLNPFWPKPDPIQQFAQVLTSALEKTDNQDDQGHVARLTGENPVAHLDYVAKRLRRDIPREARILIPIDQGEELFYSTPLKPQHQAFVDLLLEVVRADLPFVVLMALRSDYLDKLQIAGEDFVKPGTISPLGPLPVGRWREVIEKPARMAGIDVENALIDQIIADAGTGDALPLLAAVLHELYENYGRQGLQLMRYEALGKRDEGRPPLQNIVTTVAERVFPAKGVADTVKNTLRETFVSTLVQINDKGDFVRRRAEWNAIPEAARPLLDALTERRLMVKEEIDGQSFIEVAHEVLLRKWPLLNEWLEQEREFLTDRRRIRHSLEDWGAQAWQDKKNAALLHGLLLERARKWMNSHGALLAEDERCYVADSIAADDAARAHTREQQEMLVQAELDKVRLAREKAEQERLAAETITRRTRIGLAAASLLAITASYAAWHATQSEKKADHQRDQALLAQSRLLSDLSSQARRSSDPAKGMLLSLEALPGNEPDYRRPSAEEAEISLNLAYASNRQRAVLPNGYGAPIGLTLFSPDGRYLLTALGSEVISSESAPARLWDTRTGTQTVALAGGIAHPLDSASPGGAAKTDWKQAVRARHVLSADFSPDGNRLLTVLWRTEVTIWDIKSGLATVTFPLHGAHADNAYFSPDDAYAVVAFEPDEAQPGKKPHGTVAESTLRLFDGKTGAELSEINGTGNLKRIVFSADGGRFVTQGQDDQLTLWDARDRRRIAILDGHLGAVTSLAFSPDGSLIATASQDRTARLWNAKTGERLGIINGHGDALTRAVFAPSGDKLLTTSADQTARLWTITRPDTPSRVAVFKGHRGAILDASFNADGGRIITRSADNTSGLWNARNGASLVEISEGTVLFSPDGLRVLSFPNRGAFPRTPPRLWNAEDGKLIGEFDPVYSPPSFSPDGTLIVTVSGNTGIKLWNASTGEVAAAISPPDPKLGHAIFSPDGKTVAVVANDTATLVDARLGASFTSRSFEALESSSLNFSSFDTTSPDGSTQIRDSSENPNVLEIRDSAENKRIALLQGHNKPVTSRTFSSTGTRVLTASKDGTARIWSAKSGAELSVLRGDGDELHDAAFSPDDSNIVTVADNGVRIWETRGGRQIAVVALPDVKIKSAGFGPAGKYLITRAVRDDESATPLLHLWEPNGRLRTELKGHQGKLTAFAVSADGTRLLAGFSDKRVRIWDTANGRLVSELEGLDREITGALFSPDGTRLITAMKDDNFSRRVWLWDATSGRSVTRRPVSRKGGWAKFTSDGARLITASGGQFARVDTQVWDTASGNPLAYLAGTVSPDGIRELETKFPSWEGHHLVNIKAVTTNSTQFEPIHLDGHGERITAHQFSPDGTRIVTASEDGTSRIWDSATGNSLLTLRGHTAAVNSATFDRDGAVVITASADQSVRIWDAATGAQRKLIRVHGGKLLYASLSQDGNRLVTLTDDGAIRQWNPDSGAQLSAMAMEETLTKDIIDYPGSSPGRGIAVTPDGSLTLIQGKERLFAVHTFPSDQALIETAQHAAPRCLAPTERQSVYLDAPPPVWCIEQSKWPYHTVRWKAWLEAKRKKIALPQPVEEQTTAEGAEQAYQAGRFAEALELQMPIAETFANASNTEVGGEASRAAWAYAHLARYALFSKKYEQALAAAEHALELDSEKFDLAGKPDGNAYMNQAHALMFLGRPEEALAIHRKHRGDRIDNDGDVAERYKHIGDVSFVPRATHWEDGVRVDFARFRSLGMDHPQMTVIEKELYGAPPPPQSDGKG